MIELIVTIILIVTHNFTVEDTRFSFRCSYYILNITCRNYQILHLIFVLRTKNCIVTNKIHLLFTFVFEQNFGDSYSKNNLIRISVLLLFILACVIYEKAHLKSSSNGGIVYCLRSNIY